MVSPCPRCGDMRAEPLHRSFLYPLFKRFGYRYSECARCGRRRLLVRREKDKHRHSHESKSQAASSSRPLTPSAASNESTSPAVNSTEKIATAPAMAATANAPIALAETVTPEDEANAAAKTHRRRYTCPFCGSGDCRISRRRFWERLTGKGKMLRCRQCRKRFPRPSDLAAAA